MLKDYGYYLNRVFQIPDPNEPDRYMWAVKKLREGLPVQEGNFNVISSQWEWTPLIVKSKHGGRVKKSTYEYCVKVWDEWFKGNISMTKLAKKFNLEYADVNRVCSRRNLTYIDYFMKWKAERKGM